MFLSMTGFGRAEHTFPWGTVTFEIASVNHRYQEINVRLPREISSLESRIVSSLRSALKRGKIRLNADINWASEYKTVKVDTDVLCSYYTQLQELSGQLNAPSVADLTAFLPLPGVCDSPRIACGYDGDPDSEKNWDVLLAETVGVMMEMKKSEGAKLQAVIDTELGEFERLVGALAERWNTASAAALDALKSRIEKIMERFELEIDQNRIAQEISLLADRWDVSEELARLAAHIAKFGEISGAKESEGRKLDFLIQEMNREVNTMGSKVGDAEFRWMVVEAKSCLERIREQIQNVE